MKKWLHKRIKNEKGLTLVELLAVIVIIAIIAAIAIPSIGNIITNSKINALKADGHNVLAAANMYFMEEKAATATGTVTVTQLKAGGYLEDAGGFTGDEAAETAVTVTKSTTVETGNKLSGTASNGTSSVQFVNATIADINAVDNKTSSTEVVITR